MEVRGVELSASAAKLAAHMGMADFMATVSPADPVDTTSITTALSASQSASRSTSPYPDPSGEHLTLFTTSDSPDSPSVGHDSASEVMYDNE